MIGACGFIFREGWDEPELGWNVHDGYEGKGYAFEAAMAARAHGATHFDLDGILSYIDPYKSSRLSPLRHAWARPLSAKVAVAWTPKVADIYRHPTTGDTA